MKQKFLLLGAMLLLSISASAQNFTATWEKPAAPEFGSFEPETEFYLWNVGAGGFYTCWQGGDGSPYWGTRASVNDTLGNLVKFTRTNPDADQDAIDQAEIWPNAHENTYLLTSYVNTRGFNRFRCTFFDGWNAIWCDNETHRRRFFDIEKSGSYIKIVGCQDAMYDANELVDGEGNPVEVYDFTGKYLGVRENSDDPVLFLYDTAEGRIGADEKFYAEWAIVTPAAYEAYMELSKNIVKAIAAAEALRADIEKAYATYPEINLDAQIAVYNNTSSTVEQLQHAQAAVAFRVAIEKALTDYPGLELPDQMAVYNDPNSTDADYKASQAAMTPIILAFAAKNASPENPVNFSASIVNATFDTVGDFTGWKGTSFGAGGTTSTCAEHYSKTFDTYQEIDLTGYPGVYAVKVKGFHRVGGAQASWNTYKSEGEDTNAFLYISSESFGTVKTPIKNIAVAALDSDPGNGAVSVTDEDDGSVHYVPNTMLSATSDYFTQDPCPYQVVAVNAVKDGEKLKIGVIKESNLDTSWACFDDFELWYYGNTAEAYTTIKENILAGLNLEIPEDAHYGQPDLDAYNAAVEGLKKAGTAEEIGDAVKAVDTAKTDINNSILAYAAYLAKAQEAQNWLIDSKAEGGDADKLADYLNTSAADNADMEDYEFPNGVLNYIIDIEHQAKAGRLTGAEIIKETAYLTELLETAIRTSLKPGDNLTYMIKNPGFDDDVDINSGNAEGWTIDSGTGGNITRGPLGAENKKLMEGALGKMNYCFEAWHRYNWDVWQEITDLPAGIYELSVQGYVRCEVSGYTRGNDIEPDYPSPVYLYMNNAMSKFPSVYSESPTELGKEMVEVESWYSETVNGNEYPNSMGGAAQCFGWDMYKTKAYGFVEKDGGNFRIGVKMKGTQDWWCIWDNFQLKFVGKDVAAMTSIINDYAARVDAITDEYGKPEEAALADARTAALQAKDADTMYDALLALVAAYNDALTSIDLYKEVNTLIESYTTQLYDADFMAEGEPDAVNAAIDYFETTFMNIPASREMNNEEVQAAIDQMAALYAAALVPAGLDDATVENPVNLTKLITNPTFDTIGDFTGWTGGFGAGGTTSTNAECWMKTFDVYQDVTVPREGTYEVTVNGGYRSGWASNDYKDWQNNEQNNCYFYAKTTTSQVSCYVKHASEGGRPDSDWSSTNAGTEENPWYIANSMLEYENYFHDQTDENGNPIEPYRVKNVINVTADDEKVIRIGVKKDVVNDGDWAIFDDFELWYLGKDGLPNGEDALIVEGINSNEKATVVGVYTVGGTRLINLQRGINIVRMSDGTVRKLYVK